VRASAETKQGKLTLGVGSGTSGGVLGRHCCGVSAYQMRVVLWGTKKKASQVPILGCAALFVRCERTSTIQEKCKIKRCEIEQSYQNSHDEQSRKREKKRIWNEVENAEM
jgi:hypothetical protein